jgi:carbon monoxide dehydrogenase subunit G
MKLENNFTVPANVETTWRAFNDPETVAPCFPGATLNSAEGDSFTGTVKVKLGPISLTYKGKGSFVERDEANHRVVIDAQGSDSRGNGTANAHVTGTLTAEGDSQTSVKMITDMTITGRPAQLGRGLISDVSDRIVAQFSSALADRLGEAGSAAAASPTPTTASPSPSSEATTASPSPSSEPTTAAARPSPKPRTSGPSEPATSETPPPPSQAMANGASRARSSRVEAIDLLDAAGAPVLKRLIPAAVGFALLLIVFVLLRRRRSR